jgi:type II secretory pathway component PulK
MVYQHKRRNSDFGGIGVRVLLAVFTLIVIGVAIAFMLKTAQQRQQESHRKAEQISLFGMQTALEKVGSDPSWKGGFDRVSYDGGWYSVSVRRFKTGDTLMLELKSEGHMGNVSDSKSCLFAWSDSAWVPRGMH